MISLAEILKAAGEPTRLRILNLLQLGAVCVSDLHSLLEVSQPTVSRHLAVLRYAGLVADFREGSRVLYSLSPAASPQLQALWQLLEHCCSAEGVLREDLSRLKRAVREGECRLVATERERHRKQEKRARNLSVAA